MVTVAILGRVLNDEVRAGWFVVFAVFNDRGKGRPEDRRDKSNSRSGGSGGGEEKREDESVMAEESTSTADEEA